MGRTYRVDVSPDGVSFAAAAADNLMQLLARHSIILTAPCGGKGVCKKCRVLVREPGREVQEVLACQYRVHSDICVTVPGASRVEVSSGEVEPSEAIRIALSEELFPSVALDRLDKSRETSRILGLAVDLGTTTVSAALIDLESGEALGFATVMNQQTQFGADVITRIGYSQRGKESRRELSKVLAASVQVVADALLSRAGCTTSDVYQIVFAGNTTMFATLLELDCTQLVTPPYSAPLLEPLTLQPQNVAALGELGLPRWTRLDFLPAIGGYVGSDVLAGLLIAKMREQDGALVFLDIGTNGEAVVFLRGRAVASSAAAGPAFEGGEISCGMPAMPGAIQSVRYEDGRLATEVVGGVEAIGICGSGLIDACASLVRLGVIEPSGRFCERAGALPGPVAGGMRRKGSQAAFFLHENVYLTQEDVRKTQLAKGAIRTCIEFLLNEAQVEAASVKKVVLGGAFGSLIDPCSAETIGLIPTFEHAEKESLGNTALAGAMLALLSRRRLDEMRELQKKIRYVNLAGRAEFEERFTQNLAFG
ncbi:MAG TPA: ASKHA domain-containing protein [bacterium]|nr:ASKHA domain-containing protein [bacterium]